jgi:hypothetical protein
MDLGNHRPADNVHVAHAPVADRRGNDQPVLVGFDHGPVGAEFPQGVFSFG